MKGKIPEELTLSGVKKRLAHPLNDPVCRFVLLVSAGCLLVWFLHVLIGFSPTFSICLVGLLATAAWVAAIKMLLYNDFLERLINFRILF